MKCRRSTLWLLVVTPLLGGCSTALEAPELGAADGAEPRTVFLIDHGRHPSLVLPRASGGGVRYAYGDFTWFAESETHWSAGARALLLPTQGALGRQELDPWGSAAELRRRIPEGVEHMYGLVVAESAVLALVSRLDDLHDSPPGGKVYNPRFGLTFAPHPEAYWLLNNSNMVTAEWLEDLGVRVSGPALLSRWRMDQ